MIDKNRNIHDPPGFMSKHPHYTFNSNNVNRIYNYVCKRNVLDYVKNKKNNPIYT